MGYIWAFLKVLGALVLGLGAAVAYLALWLLGAFLSPIWFYIWTGLNFLLLIVAFVIKWRWPDKLKFWNVKKGLSGTVFGDSANFFAVIAGLGSYTLLGQGEGWWRLGLVGGMVALLVGLSLHYRWMNIQDFYGRSFGEQVTALTSELVGVFTILALLSPGPETTLDRGELIASGIISAVLIAVVAGMLVHFYRKRVNKPPIRAGFIYTLVVLFLSLGAVIAIPLTNHLWKGFKGFGQVMGIFAALCWMLTELFSSFPTTLEMLQGNFGGVDILEDYFGWEKSIWEVIGALITTITLIIFATGFELDPNAVNTGKLTLSWTDLAMTAVFFGGASVGGLGTLRGIVNGILKLRRKRLVRRAAARPRRHSI